MNTATTTPAPVTITVEDERRLYLAKLTRERLAAGRRVQETQLRMDQATLEACTALEQLDAATAACNEARAVK